MCRWAFDSGVYGKDPAEMLIYKCQSTVGIYRREMACHPPGNETSRHLEVRERRGNREGGKNRVASMVGRKPGDV